uniref:Uncharacterized protein n=1 Tax=Trypanosoma vivax (strain Y486) TaxID=1055687 RepID=G0UAD2_TRYVY|nr:hypothetical protein TVY486_1102500 [Trypanosoma vivax Y486]
MPFVWYGLPLVLGRLSVPTGCSCGAMAAAIAFAMWPFRFPLRSSGTRQIQKASLVSTRRLHTCQSTLRHLVIVMAMKRARSTFTTETTDRQAQRTFVHKRKGRTFP